MNIYFVDEFMQRTKQVKFNIQWVLGPQQWFLKKKS